MPADPELPPSSPAVETMLRDAARQRHAAFDAATGPDAASTMPDHVRARLHAELAKRFDAPAAGKPPGNWLARWWPALFGTLGASLAVALFVFTGGPRPPSPPPAVAARQDVAPAAPLPREVAAVKPALPAPEPSSPAAATADADVAQANTVPPADGPEPVRTQTFTRSPLPLAAVAGGRGSTGDLLRAAPATVNAPAAPAAKAKARRGPAAESAAAPATPPLLGNFQFEQRGENVRVVDADGSVYVGQVQPPALSRQEDKAAAAASSSRARGTLAATAEGSPNAGNAQENFRFRATGDNRTLRKPVMFEGEYTATAAPAARPAPPGADRSLQPPRPAPANAATAPEAQIRGRVWVLGDQREQRDAEVDARSVP